MAALRPVAVRKTLFLCTDERTGSHLLASLLASTGALGRAYEYLNTEWMKRHYAEYPDLVPEQLAWAKRLGTTANGVFSIKLHPWAADDISPHFDLVQDFPDPRFVLLRRVDLLGQAISMHKAQSSNSFTSWSPVQAEPQYDGDRILSLVRELAMRRERWEVYFARNGITPFRLDYEELIRNPRRIVREIAAFAGVKRPGRIGRYSWYSFERQADSTNAAWRARFLAENRDTRHLDRLGTV
jgi:LPS sulfotransferase NodH